MKRSWYTFSGIVGTVLFTYAVAGYFLIGAVASGLLLLHLALGSLLLLIWLVAYFWKAEPSLPKEQVLLSSRTVELPRQLLKLLALAIILLLANAAVRYLHVRFDFTAQRVYSLSEETRGLLSRLERSVQLAVVRHPQLEESAFDLLQLVKAESKGLVEVQSIDPLSQPHLLERFQFARGEILSVGYTDSDQTAIRTSEVSEQEIATALLRLQQEGERKVYFIEGFECS